MLPRHPVKSRIGLKSVWFDGECRQVRRRVRCAERRFRRTKNPDDRLSWIALLRSLHRLHHRKEAAYWENLVARNSKNPKRLWSFISGMLGKPSRPLESCPSPLQIFLTCLLLNRSPSCYYNGRSTAAVFYNCIHVHRSLPTFVRFSSSTYAQ